MIAYSCGNLWHFAIRSGETPEAAERLANRFNNGKPGHAENHNHRIPVASAGFAAESTAAETKGNILM
jgi:hypothetical protein